MDDIETNKWIICRVCLKSSTKVMQKIFAAESEVENLAQKIEQCSGLPLKTDEYLPDSICSKCVKLLKVAHKFRTLFQRSHRQLTQLLQLNDTVQKVSIEIKHEQLQTASATSSAETATTTTTIYEVKQELECKQNSGADDDVEQFSYIIEDVAVDNENDMLQDENYECVGYDAYQQVEYLQDDSMQNCELTTEEQNDENSNSNATTEDITDDQINEHSTEKFDYENNASDTNIMEEQPTSSLEKIATNVNALQDNYKVEPKCNNNDKTILRKRYTLNKIKSIEESVFICTHCGNIYNEKPKLTLHMKNHTKEKPHECEICFKRFAQTPQLARHMNTHTGNRPYGCAYRNCNARFADPSTCIKHQRIHTNERPFKCEICEKSFAYSNVLKVHMMTHTGEKPFSCNFCDKKFAQLHHKKAHERTHSNDDKSNVTL